MNSGPYTLVKSFDPAKANTGVARDVGRAVRVGVEVVHHVQPRVGDVAEHVLRQQRRREREQDVRAPRSRRRPRARRAAARPASTPQYSEQRDPQPGVEEGPGQAAVGEAGAQRLERAEQPVAATRRWWPAPRPSQARPTATASATYVREQASAERRRRRPTPGRLRLPGRRLRLPVPPSSRVPIRAAGHSRGPPRSARRRGADRSPGSRRRWCRP